MRRSRRNWNHPVASSPAKELPVPGERFVLEGCPAFLIRPGQVVAGREMPWVWYAPTLPGLPAVEERWMFQKFLAAGMAIAGIDVGESFGNPRGREIFTALHQELAGKRGFAPKPCLLARSRGGLMLYNWAAEHPSSVSCIAGIYPVVDLASYPGIETACKAYGMTAEQLAAQLVAHNPIDRLRPLAEAHVPIYHIHGDRDDVVPLDRNSGALARRYRELGGQMTLNVVKGGGHDYWTGWFQCQELVDFVIAHACGGVHS
jgi:pimeloyl-ACP methyl ester carboxylesterase